jgi:hypothetical protein
MPVVFTKWQVTLSELLESTITKVVGRHLVQSGKKQIDEHVEWMHRHGFTKDWEDFAGSPADARTSSPAPVQLQAT